MIHKNYKWNISEEEGRDIVYNNIEILLNERSNKTIEIEELIFLLNNRTKNIDIRNNNKKKNLSNFIKVICGGMINFLDDYSMFMLDINEKHTFVKLNQIETNDWIFVEDE
jgi:hypothetical protein